jgi:uncharacterized protein YlxW (UPF0749 family)
MAAPISILKPLRLNELSRSVELSAPLSDRMRRCRSMTNDSPRRSYAVAVARVQATVLERRASAIDLGVEASLILQQRNERLEIQVNELASELDSFEERLIAFESADIARQRRIAERCDDVARHLYTVRTAIETEDPDDERGAAAAPPAAAASVTPEVNDVQLDVDADFECAHRSALFCDAARRVSGQPVPDVAVAILDALAAAETKRHSFSSFGRSGIEALRRWRQRNDTSVKVDGDELARETLADSMPECALASERRIVQIRDELKQLNENREEKAARVTELLSLSRSIGPRSLEFEAVIEKRVLGVVFRGDTKHAEYAALCRLSPHMVVDSSVASNGLFFGHGLVNFDTFAHLGRSAFSTFVLRARIAAFDDHITADAYCRAAVEHAPAWLATFFLEDEIASLLPRFWMHSARSEADRIAVATKQRRALPFALLGMFEFMNSLVCSRWLQRLLYEHYSASLVPPSTTAGPTTAAAPVNSKKLERSSTIRRKRIK